MDALEFVELVEKISIEEIAIKNLQDNETIIADINATQLSQGKRSDGSDITPEYTPLTIELKKGRGGLAGVTDRVTLFDTGDHYRQLYADVKGLEIEYGSRDEKSAKLEKKYATKSAGLYGLNDDSREELVEGYLQPAFQKEYENQTGLKFD